MTRPDYVPDDAEDITDWGAWANPDDDDEQQAIDNRNAIHDAANASPGGNVYIPEGTYYYGRADSSPSIRFGIEGPLGGSLYGDGPNKSTLAISSQTDVTSANNMIEYEQGSHGEVEVKQLRLFGNDSELENPGDGIDIKSDSDVSLLTVSNVHFEHIWMRGIRNRCNSVIEWCTFEHVGIQQENDSDGSSITHHITWSPYDSNQSLTVERCLFTLGPGNAINDSNPGGTIDVSNCYAEGIGDTFIKHSSADLMVRNTYIEPNAAGIEDAVVGGRHGRAVWKKFDEDPSVEATFEHVEARNCTDTGFRVSNDHSATISGDMVALHNIGFDLESREAMWVRNNGSDTDILAWDNFGNLSVHGVADNDVFGTPDGRGNIDTLHWDDATGIGTPGDTTIDTIEEGGSPFQPDVPSRDEVGIAADRQEEERDTDDQEQDEDDVDEPLFDDWTPQWESDHGDWDIISGSEFEGGYALRFGHDGDDRTRYAISFDPVGEPSDVEILDKFRVPAFTQDENLGFHARVNLRSSGARGNENGYWIEIEDREDAFRLSKYTDGDLTTMERFGTPVENTFFYRRFRAEGNELKGKIWQADEPEPSDWDVELTDEDHSSGWVGLGSFDTGIVETDVFSVATGGESARIPGDNDTEERLSLEILNATDVDDSSATLSGELTELEGHNSATVYFEWGKSGEGFPNTTDEQVLESTGEFNEEVTDLDSDTEYEFRAIAEVDDSETSDTLTFRTSTADEEDAVPVIEQFDIVDESNPVWSRFDVDWAVSHADGELDTVITKLRYKGATVAAESTNVSGETASYTHVVRVRGDVDEVRLSVNDTENQVTSETKEV